MPHLETPGGTRLFHTDTGSGPPVLFVHAWSLSSAMWEYQVRAFVDAGFRCVAMDRRGHGRSDVPGSGYDLDTLAADLAALVEHLDLRDLTVVAHSMGTCEVTRYLAAHGTDRVARVAFLGAMTPHLAGAVGTAFVEGMVADLVADRPRWFHDSAPAYFATAGTGSWVSRALVDDGIRQILATPLEVQVATLRAFTGTDLRPTSRRSTCRCSSSTATPTPPHPSTSPDGRPRSSCPAPASGSSRAPRTACTSPRGTSSIPS
jgi:non-heme chloroperoxidase